VRMLEKALGYLIYAVRVVQKLGLFKKNSFRKKLVKQLNTYISTCIRKLPLIRVLWHM